MIILLGRGGPNYAFLDHFSQEGDKSLMEVGLGRGTKIIVTRELQSKNTV